MFTELLFSYEHEINCVLICDWFRFPTNQMSGFIELAKEKGMADTLSTVCATGGGAYKFEQVRLNYNMFFTCKMVPTVPVPYFNFLIKTKNLTGREPLKTRKINFMDTVHLYPKSIE
jgi:hypothetical protein